MAVSNRNVNKDLNKELRDAQIVTIGHALDIAIDQIEHMKFFIKDMPFKSADGAIEIIKDGKKALERIK